MMRIIKRKPYKEGELRIYVDYDQKNYYIFRFVSSSSKLISIDGKKHSYNLKDDSIKHVSIKYNFSDVEKLFENIK